MGHSGFLLFLVSFIFLWDFQEHELAEGSLRAKCPKKEVTCEYEEIGQCTKDQHCPDKKKCCDFSCGMKCLDVKADVCTDPLVIGTCVAYTQRWTYIQETNSCERFTYSGCAGNGNNFQSESVCLQICEKKPKKKSWYQWWKLEDLQDLQNVSQSRAFSMNS